MKTKEWATPNRMQFDSPLKSFNRQVTSISTGNVWGGTQHSGYIRAFTKKECNGATFDIGHLQRYDLEQFESRLPRLVLDEAKYQLTERGGILYHFFYRNKDKRITIGAVLTTTTHKKIKAWYLGSTAKQSEALDECLEYITED